MPIGPEVMLPSRPTRLGGGMGALMYACIMPGIIMPGIGARIDACIGACIIGCGGCCCGDAVGCSGCCCCDGSSCVGAGAEAVCKV
jgi:hypothetical protein